MVDIDQSTVNALIEGEESAYAAVIDSLYQPVFRFSYRLCHDSASAEDITQETFLVVWQGIKSYKRRSRFSTWVFGIAYRQYLRIRNKRTTDPLPEEKSSSVNESDPCEQIQIADLQLRVQKALASLPDIYRYVVFLVYIQGFTYRETAYVLDLPIGTVKSRMNYAFNILRGELGGEEVMQYEMP
ncbi:MAG: RNA polymerase sigma factor [Armatimonadetes bacterium]|nr:RNA polymerase sigma factor [Armatimonadota bacterium]